MSICTKIYYMLTTVCAKLFYGSSISIDGLFRKRLDTHIKISCGGKLIIGENVSFSRNVELASVMGGVIRIGKNVFFNRNCMLMCRKEIIIDDDVIFGPGVTIYDHDHKFTEKGIMPGYNHDIVFIGKGSWVGTNVIILRGTNIGEGCVIGAGVVVQGVVPSHSLVTSNRELKIIPLIKRAK